MFETDDFDEVLSQLEVTIPRASPNTILNTPTADQYRRRTSLNTPIAHQPRSKKIKCFDISEINVVSPKESCSKENRDKLNSVFNSNAKRVFPGPAGILKDALENKSIEDLTNIEVISQDIEAFNSSHKFNSYGTQLWHVCVSELSSYGLEEPTSIEKVKNHAGMKMLRKQKAGVIVALIESIERSASDLLIRLRDQSDVIKCTLHRDAWSKLSNFIIAEGTVIVLRQPTVFTIGTSHKRHYLNITLANIVALFSLHQVATQEVLVLPDGFEKEEKESCIIIKRIKEISSGADYDHGVAIYQNETQIENSKLQNNMEEDLFDELDEESFFNEDF